MYSGKNKLILFLFFVTPFCLASPEEQRQFEDLICSTKWEYLEEQNEILKAKVIQKRENGIKTVLRGSLAFTNWTGVITEIDVLSTDKVALTVSIGCKIKLKTWNNTFSDLFDGTLIDLDSKVGDSLSKLFIGNKVKVAGSFVPGLNTYIKEISLTNYGQMREPEYLVHFREIFN